MRFYLEYINHLGRLQRKSTQLVRQAHQPFRHAGFTITEVLLAGVMMLIAVLVSGIGVINLLRSNYRANADSEIRNNLNRTLEFVSDDVRRARIIANADDAIVTDQVAQARAAGSRVVLAFQISNPNNPGQAPLPNQIVYYTTGPENSLTGPRVLWRFGPNLDANGNYITPADIATWIRSPVTDMLASAANNPNCPADFNLIDNPDAPPVDGFFACVRNGGGQVILNANAQVEMTTVTAGTRDRVDYAASTRVSARATNNLFFLAAPPNTDRVFGSIAVITLPVLTANASVQAQVIGESFCASCTVTTGPLNNLQPPEAIPSTVAGRTILGNSGDTVIVAINPNLTNRSWNTQTERVQAFTSTSRNPPRSLENNQVLLMFTTPSGSYQVLLTITPR